MSKNSMMMGGTLLLMTTKLKDRNNNNNSSSKRLVILQMHHHLIRNSRILRSQQSLIWWWMMITRSWNTYREVAKNIVNTEILTPKRTIIISIIYHHNLSVNLIVSIILMLWVRQHWIVSADSNIELCRDSKNYKSNSSYSSSSKTIS